MLTLRAKPWREQRGDRLMTMLFVTLVVPVIIALLIFHRRVDTGSWPSVTGHVLATRIVVVGAEEHAFSSGAILYRAEAHVSYGVNGRHFDRWLPASDIKRDKAYLETWLSHKSDLCTVHWNPENSSDIEAVLGDAPRK